MVKGYAQSSAYCGTTSPRKVLKERLNLSRKRGLESPRSETSGILSKGLRIEIEQLELLDSGIEVVGSLLVEEHTSCTVNVGPRLTISSHHRLQAAPTRVCDDRRPGRLGFHRGDPKILFTGEQESSTPSIEGGNCAILDPASEFDVRRRERAEAPVLWAVTDNDQLSSRTRKRRDRDIDTLVGDERGNDQVEILSTRRRRMKPLEVHGGVHNGRGSVIQLLDFLAYVV